MTTPRDTLADLIEAAGTPKAAADAVLANVPGLRWEDKTVEIVDGGIKIHLGPYSIKIWNGKLGARLEYLENPLQVFPNANGLAVEVKAAAEADHRARLAQAMGWA